MNHAHHEAVTPIAEIAREGVEGVEAAVVAIYGSPRFLMSVADGSTTGAGRTAADLAHLLWRGPPDEALLRCATEGAACDWDAEIERLLQDERVERWVEGFLGSWLAADLLERRARPYPVLLPQGDAAALRRELVTRFSQGVRDGAKLQDVLDPDDGGLLSSPGMIALMDASASPHPTRRGAWVLRRLLCEPVGSPPSTIDVPDSADRDVLAEVTAAPACRACHDRTDPIGFALADRDNAGRVVVGVDASGALPGSGAVQGARELGRGLAHDPRTAACVARFMIGHATSTLPDLPSNGPHVAELARELTENGLEDALRWLARQYAVLGVNP